MLLDSTLEREKPHKSVEFPTPELTSRRPARPVRAQIAGVPCALAARFPDQRAVAAPVEIRPGIGLAPGSDVAVSGALRDGKARAERRRERREHGVLHVLERRVVGSLELDADREIVAAGPSLPGGFPGMPRPAPARDELDQLSRTAYQKMGGHSQSGDPSVIRMPSGIEAVGEKTLDAVPAELPGRQADRVDYDQLDGRALGTVIAIGRWNPPHALEPSLRIHLRRGHHVAHAFAGRIPLRTAPVLRLQRARTC